MGWDKGRGDDSPTNLLKRIRSVSEELKRWGRNKIGKFKSRIAESKRKIEALTEGHMEDGALANLKVEEK